MTTYFTSDTHFGHDRTFIYEPRGFNSIEEHDSEIIKRWNSIVAPDDVVYHLGDVMLGTNYEYGLNCARQLNGTIHIIRGNHDTDRRWNEYLKLWPQVILYGWSEVIKIDGYKLYLCHFKTETSSIENMAPLKKHLINLHGHTHSNQKFESDDPFQYNVALDAHSCYPVSLKEIVYDIEEKAKECLSFL
jgi:calcineurin-like phosphoesterase family protein